jgi:predicted RecA/RadA family phage recombinase
MEAVLVHGTEVKIDHTPGSAVSAGEVLTYGEHTVIASRDIASGALGAVAVPSGNAVYDFTKVAADSLAFAVGALVYWNATDNKVSATVTDKGVGICVKAAGTSDTTVRALHTPIKVKDLDT